MVAEILIFVISALYFAIMFGALRGLWQYRQQATVFSGEESETQKFSIIIPFRNEAQRILPLLQSILYQNYPKDHCEWLFVDDFSNDNSAKRIEQTLNGKVDFKIISSPKAGKKNAQLAGAQAAQHNRIIFLDADVELCSPAYLYEVNRAFMRCDLLIMPVIIKQPVSVFGWWSYYEQLVLNALNAGLSRYNQYLFANGANLGVTKEAFLQSFSVRNDMEIASGDDVFLLQAIQKQQRLVKLAFVPDLVVSTPAPENGKEFFHQKIRWASKMRYLSFNFSIFTGSVITLFHFLYLILPILSVNQTKYVEYFAIIFLFKMMIDKMLLFLVVKILNFGKIGFAGLVISALYPVYQVLVFTGSMFFSTYEWKSRKIKN